MADLVTKLRDLANFSQSFDGRVTATVVVMREAAEEIERLTAIVDRLLKTADGVPIGEGMPIFYRIGGHVLEGKANGTVCRISGRLHVGITGGRGYADDWRMPAHCYSTREAAKAKEEGYTWTWTWPAGTQMRCGTTAHPASQSEP